MSREMARLCSVSIKSHQSSSSGQLRSANRSRHMPRAVSSCTHFWPFSQENLQQGGSKPSSASSNALTLVVWHCHPLEET